MSKIKLLFVISLFLVFAFSNHKAQTGSIQLVVQDLNSIDLASFAFEQSLENQPRIFQVFIQTNPPGAQVSVGGVIRWKKNDANDFMQIVNFRTENFAAQNFSNNDIGTNQIELRGDSEYNSDLLIEMREIGKPTGIIEIQLFLYNEFGIEIDKSEPPTQLYFLNPTPPMLLLPAENAAYDIGSVLVQWTPSIGVSTYRIKASYLNEGQAKEEALEASNPLVNDRDVGNVNSVNLRDILDRELLADKNIVIVVKAIIPKTGGEEILASPIVTFRTNALGSESIKSGISQTDPVLLKLAEFLKDRVSQSFIDQILSGEITAAEIQITDESNNPLSFTDLQSILDYLILNSETVVNVNLTAK